jgi:hypothetical protein
MATVDFTDPCAVVGLLRQAHFEIVTGKAVATVAYDGKSVSYSKADLPALEKAIAKYENECAALFGKRRRFAVRAGGI